MSELSFRPARVPTNDSKNSVTSTESTSKRPSASAPSSGGEAQSINQNVAAPLKIMTSTPSARRTRLTGRSPLTGDDGMITVRAHNKKTGEITVMHVKRGTPMREVMASYASNKGVKAERLSWKRRSSAASTSSPTSRDGSVVVGEKRLDEDGGDECGLPACGCTGFS